MIGDKGSTNFPTSSMPHSTMKIGRTKFCPGCSDDFAVQFSRYLNSWRAWGTPDAKLFLTGRLQYFSQTRGGITSAAKVGWHLDLKNSKVLKTRGEGGSERFPAMAFTAGKSCEAIADALIEQYELVFGDGR